MSKKNPFVGFTLEEALNAESNAYTIQVGDDFVLYNGEFAFSKKQTAALYNQIKNELVAKFYSKNIKERVFARQCLLNFRILPLRIQ